ncbi:MAG: adenylate/guanylate cyclase domain-containing protein [Isosphaerales bacterium]
MSSRTGGRERLLHRAGPLEFGRGPEREVPRKLLLDPTVSINQLSVEEQENDRVLVRNLSTKVTVRLADGSLIKPGGELAARLPTRIHVGDNTLIEIESADRGAPAAEALLLKTIEPPIAAGSLSKTLAPRLAAAPVPEELARWFESLVGVQRAAASSPDFFAETARAVVALIGLDCGLVILRKGIDWVAHACHPPCDDPQNQFSRFILETVSRERRTFYQEVPATTSSLEDVAAVVASPIFDEAQNVIGAVYGSRRGAGRSPEISPLEAQLTQVLAAAVAAGLARLQSEAQAARRRVQFEQFFTPELAGALDRDPTLLEGREREVTVLFADIRGFSEVSERLTPRLSCELIRDVMEHLTAKIVESAGVVVDYMGDGLLAMWNAPVEQLDHAARACRAALAMRDGLPELNRRWEDRLGRPLGLGIGLNSGPALVGNTGSQKKFKYGPLGHTVNLGSRVEGATKHLGVGLLITGSTRDRLNLTFATRRLCRARVVGIACEVDLHELHSESESSDWQSRRETYERALALYEAGEWSQACQALFPLLTQAEGTYDLPSLTLLGRAVECIKAPPPRFDPVLELKSK